MKPFFKTKELAERWGCSEMHVYRLVSKQELNAVKIGKLLRFRYEDILEYEKTQATDKVSA